MRKGEQERIAGLAGVRPETISRWKSGENINARIETVERLANALGVSVAYLLGQADEAGRTDKGFLHAAESPAPPYGDGSEYVPVPYFAVDVAAGAGAIIDERTAVREHHLMRREWVKRHARGRLIRVRVNPNTRFGESMIPTIRPGAILTVDLEHRPTVRPGLIYLVVNDDGWTSVKRVYPMPEAHALLCVSDNPAHPPFTIHPDRDGARVLGRVLRWEQGEE